MNHILLPTLSLCTRMRTFKIMNAIKFAVTVVIPGLLKQLLLLYSRADPITFNWFRSALR